MPTLAMLSPGSVINGVWAWSDACSTKLGAVGYAGLAAVLAVLLPVLTYDHAALHVFDLILMPAVFVAAAAATGRVAGLSAAQAAKVFQRGVLLAPVWLVVQLVVMLLFTLLLRVAIPFAFLLAIGLVTFLLADLYLARIPQALLCQHMIDHDADAAVGADDISPSTQRRHGIAASVLLLLGLHASVLLLSAVMACIGAGFAGSFLDASPAAPVFRARDILTLVWPMARFTAADPMLPSLQPSTAVAAILLHLAVESGRLLIHLAGFVVYGIAVTVMPRAQRRVKSAALGLVAWDAVLGLTSLGVYASHAAGYLLVCLATFVFFVFVLMKLRTLKAAAPAQPGDDTKLEAME